MRDVLASSWWRHVAAVTVAVAVFGTCLGPAVWGHQHWNLGGAVGAAVGVLSASRYRDAEFWRLSVPDRRRVLAARRTGRPSWDAPLDLIALRQLESTSRGAGGRWAVATVMVVLVVGTPVAAAVRTGHGWYLLALVALAVPLAAALRELGGEDPRVRLARLRTAMDDGPPAEVSPAGTGR